MHLTVTAEFLKDLRKAESVLMRNDIPDGENGGTIRFQWKKYRTHEVESKYFFDSEVRFSKLAKFCFHSMFKTISGWEALGLILRVGDKLYFNISDNRNQYVEHCIARSIDENGRVRETYEGMHHDQLTVSVYRRGNEILQRLVLESSVCPDNSARSVKGYYEPEPYTPKVRHYG